MSGPAGPCRHLLAAVALAVGPVRPAVAQDAVPARADGPAATPVTALPASAPPATDAAPTPEWIATLSSGVLARDGDSARPYGVAGLSRKLGRGYVRVAVTGFESVLKQVDATLPSSFALASLGAGGTFGSWFVDGAASAGRQFYGDVITAAGTRANGAGDGSDVYGASLDGGRFLPLARRLYLTPSLAVQYSTEQALRSLPGPGGPIDFAMRETAWTGSATVRLDRFFGPDSRHIAGLSLSRVRTSNGAVALASGLAGTTGQAALVGVADGWSVAGASASLQVARRLWLDQAATRTAGAQSGDVTTLSLGLRLGL